jgi:glucan phosphoethanolaminetransferase (alkaline phosphatase superfamily)
MPYFIFFHAIYRIRILKQDWRPIIAKSVISLIMWLALSFGMLMIIFFGFIYGDRFGDTPPTMSEAAASLLFLFIPSVVYGFLGCDLCNWVKGTLTKEVIE